MSVSCICWEEGFQRAPCVIVKNDLGFDNHLHSPFRGGTAPSGHPCPCNGTKFNEDGRLALLGRRARLGENQICPPCKILEGVSATYVPPRSCGAAPTPLAPTPFYAYSNIIKQLIGSEFEMENVMTRWSGIPPNTPKCLGNTPGYPLNTP